MKNPCNECKHLVFSSFRKTNLPFCKERENPEPQTVTTPERICIAFNKRLFNLKAVHCNKFSLLTKIKQDNDRKS